MAVSGSDEQYKAEETGSYLLEFYFGGKFGGETAVSGSNEQYKAEGTGPYLLEFHFGGKSLLINKVIGYILFSFPNNFVFFEQ